MSSIDSMLVTLNADIRKNKCTAFQVYGICDCLNKDTSLNLEVYQIIERTGSHSLQLKRVEG